MGELNPFNLPAAGSHVPKGVAPETRNRVIQPSIEGAASAPAFMNDRVPQYELEVEKPHHRQAAYMFAHGMNAKEIAEALGYTPTAVRDWLKHKWFQDNVAQLLQNNGGKDILDLLKGEAMASLVTMIELRDDAKVAPAVRLNACKDILDRFMGKATQRVEHVATTSCDDPVAEVARLEAENARLSKN